ncbi:class I adenylate-forming enzyme family protein [Streptomyces triticisoli]|uniref:class I adenylate-forming enzyme family protein n=1 Tax=Streptomyces triticisoli TaxID=2182797 RepID=UPI0013006597|nr:class I adenylate-forming enzyme family protein [Streptomyces triticisoli]
MDPTLATRPGLVVPTPHTAPAFASARPRAAGPRPATMAGPSSPSQDTLDRGFVRVAQRHPDAVAVQEVRGELSFGKAELWSTRLASMLMHADLQLGDPVIIHCDDHRQALLAQLAVLKAGGVCVPAAYGLGLPELRAIGAVSAASTVLCSSSTRETWARRHTTLALDHPETWRRITTHRLEPALPLSHPAEAAYMLVAHGGPGGPTGHLVDHRAWRLAVAERIRTAGPAPRRVFVAGPPASPAALSAMWWAFAGGASLRAMPTAGVPAERDGTLSAAVCSPEEYEALVDALPIRPRLVQLVGGPVPAGLVTRHFTALPGTRLRADLAPTDGVLPWTTREFTPTGKEPSPRALGTPVSQVQVRVVDDRGGPQTAEQPGELCATGPALPFSTVRIPGHTTPVWEEAPLLRSGLSARRYPDGTLKLADPPAPTA